MRTRAWVATACATVLGIGLALPAQAASEDDRWPIEITNPGLSQEVIDALPEVILNDPDVIVADDLQLGPIVYPDGTPVEGQSAKMVQAANSCNGTATGLGTGGWGPTSYGGCVVWGSPNYVRVYGFTKTSDSNGCQQFRGYNAQGTATWYSGGCGAWSSGVGVVWGNVLANPAARARTSSIPAGYQINWN